MVTSVADPVEQVFDALRRVRENWPGGGWSWDGRFSCVASTFSLDLAKKARTAAAEAAPAEWNEQTLPNAPQLARDVARRTGGLRSGQMLLCSEPQGGLVVFGLWWPWDNGKTISLRLGLAGGVDTSNHQQLRNLFGVTL